MGTAIQAAAFNLLATLISIRACFSRNWESQVELLIEQATVQEKPVWLVHACGMTFSFHDEASAVQFATKLQERVDAPHQLSAEAVKLWAAEHYHMLRGS